MSDQSGLSAFFEALLFIAERPLATAELAALAAVPQLQAEAALAELGDELLERGRGLRLQRLDDAWQLATAPEVGARLAAYAEREEARLTPAALEALAIVAYRQPVTRGDIDRVRGVDSDYVLRSLLHRRLVAELGRRDTPGRPILYGTTFTFLERFGLTSLEDLPPIASDGADAPAAASEPATDPAIAEPEPVDAG